MGGASAGGEGRVLVTPQRSPAGPNFTLSKLSGPSPGKACLSCSTGPKDRRPSGGARQTPQGGQLLDPWSPGSAREAAALSQPPWQWPSRAPRGRPGRIRCAHCITRPSPHPHAARPAPCPVPGAPSPLPPTYIIPLDEFGALLEAVGHAHGLELQSVHSGLSPGHLGSSGLRAARASAAGTGRWARAPFSAREALDSAPPLASPGLPASAPPPARLSRRGAQGPGAGPCPGRDAGSGARGGCGASEGEGKPSRAAEAASCRRVLLLRRRLEAHHSAHPLYTEGERE